MRALAAALWVVLLLHGALVLADHTPEAPTTAVVTLRDKPVFTLARGEGRLSVGERARGVGRALVKAALVTTPEPAHWETRGTRAVVFVGPVEVVSLSSEDAVAVGAGSLEQLAAQVTAKVQTAVATERTRSSWAKTVFSVSLVVFFGLITLYLMGKLREFCDAARDFLIMSPRRVPALRLNKLEVLGPASVRNVLIIVIGVGRVLGLIGLVYAWIVISLSLFERTRPLVQGLTFVLLDPMSALVSRIATTLPVVVVLAVAMALIAVVLRITDLFFASVARGETHLALVPPDVAHATSVVVRGGVLLVSLLFAGPILSGDRDGPLSRTALVLLVCGALAATPLLCSLLAGLATVFSRAVRLGDQIEYGGQRGKVNDFGMLWLVLEDDQGASVRVPHLRSLWFPTRVYKREAP
ncbi:MAG TPA: mechanosensitive ion channel domain-containing protein [Polyangiales bacterium]